MTRVKVPWPPALAEFRGQKYAICGSVWLPVPSETTQDDLSNYMDWSTEPKASKGSEGSQTLCIGRLVLYVCGLRVEKKVQTHRRNKKQLIENKMFLILEIIIVSGALYAVVLRDAAKYQKRRVRDAIRRRFSHRFKLN